MNLTVRVATQDDAAGVLEVYAHYVLHSAISFELEPPSVEEMRGRMEAVLDTHPWLVAVDDEGAVIGYAYGSPHRDRAAYRWSADVSVYIRFDAHRRGVGRALYRPLLALLREQGLVNAYAGIALPNPGSVAIHESFGFRRVGVYRKVGYKMGRWHDVGWWELSLAEPVDHPAEPIRFPEFSGDDRCARILRSEA
jgi:phosphinothricin acetyltransferase